MRYFKIKDIEAIDFVCLNQEEIHQVFTLRQHKSVAQWMYHQELSLKAHLDFVKNLKEESLKRYFVFKQEKVILGVGSLNRINFMHKNAYIGIYKNPELFQVGDIILEALEEIAFVHFDLHALILEVLRTNQRAIKCYERNGYKYQGILKEFVFINKNYEDVLIYEKIKTPIGS